MSEDVILVAVDVPHSGDERRKHWAKVVTNVDSSQTSGWAFEGEFIAVGGIQDVAAGSVILVYGERGSKENPTSEAKVYKANADGTMSMVTGASGRAWARTLRDEVERMLEDDTPLTRLGWSPDLLRYDDLAIVTEYERRKLGDS